MKKFKKLRTDSNLIKGGWVFFGRKAVKTDTNGDGYWDIKKVYNRKGELVKHVIR